MTDKQMPDEIYCKRYGEASGGTYWNKPREGETGTRYIRADLSPPTEFEITIPVDYSGHEVIKTDTGFRVKLNVPEGTPEVKGVTATPAADVQAALFELNSYGNMQMDGSVKFARVGYAQAGDFIEKHYDVLRNALNAQAKGE